jgi:hypothetical protein
MLEAADSLCWISDGAESAGDDGGSGKAGKDVSVGGGDTGSTGRSGRSVEGEVDIDPSGAGGNIVIGDATGGSVDGGGDVLGGAGLAGDGGVDGGGEIGKGWSWTSSDSLNSSSSQRLFRAFFTGGGAVGEGIWEGLAEGAWQDGIEVGVTVNGSVWMQIEFVLVLFLPRFRRR